MKEKIFSLNWALLESPFSITLVWVLGMGQLGGEERWLVSYEPASCPRSRLRGCSAQGCARSISTSPVEGKDGQFSRSREERVWEFRGPKARGSSAQHLPELLPVVNEAKHDWVPGVAGWCRPALGQDHLEVAFLFIEPHFDLDVITGRHAVILRNRRVSNK